MSLTPHSEVICASKISTFLHFLNIKTLILHLHLIDFCIHSITCKSDASHVCQVLTSWCTLRQQSQVLLSVLIFSDCWCVSCAPRQVDPEQQEQPSHPLHPGPASLHNPHLHGRFPWQPHPLQCLVYEVSPPSIFYTQQHMGTMIPFVFCNLSHAVIQRQRSDKSVLLSLVYTWA